MPNLFERISAAAKAFRVGQALVDPALTSYGNDNERFAPTAYGEYIAKSVGVYSCVTLRAENLAGAPLRLYKGTDPENRKAVTSGPLFELLRKVNPFWTFSQLVEMTEMSLGLWGQAYWVLERGMNGKGAPKEIWWVSPDKMKPVPHESGYIAGFIYEHQGERIPFTAGEVIWFRYPNPMDEFAGLSPIAAARLSIDLGHAGLVSNKRLFDQGMQIAGVISPADKETKWQKETVKELEEMLARRFKGVDKAHKWMIMGHAMNAEPMGINPKDAEFLGQMRWSLSDVCRVYKVSPILVQDLEKSTYSNFEQALKALWTLALKPEAYRIASAIEEQLLPLFPGQADAAEFDLSGVDVLQEGEDAKWEREEGQIAAGAITINEWRKSRGLKPVAWGDEPMKAAAPAAPPEMPGDEDEMPMDNGTPAAAAERALSLVRQLRSEAIEYRGEQHTTMMKRFDRRASRHERQFKEMVEGLFEQQLEAILAAGQGEKAITKAFDPKAPFNRAEWIELFKAAALKRIEQMIQDAGDAVFDELSVGIAFDVTNPEVAKFIQARSQRFAEEVTETTWTRLKDSLAEGTDAGETIDQLAERVTQVMGTRIKSDAETIARTETIGALNGGALEAARQSGEVEGKTWLAAIDDRTRESHVAAHGETVALDKDFSLGGPAPGQIGDPAEDINCRCTMTWVLSGGKAVRSQALEGIRAWAGKG